MSIADDFATVRLALGTGEQMALTKRELDEALNAASRIDADRARLVAALDECWPFLFGDDGSPIAPEELRERVRAAIAAVKGGPS